MSTRRCAPSLTEDLQTEHERQRSVYISSCIMLTTNISNDDEHCTNQQPPQRDFAAPTSFGLGRNGCWTFKGPSYTGHSPSFFRYAAP